MIWGYFYVKERFIVSFSKAWDKAKPMKADQLKKKESNKATTKKAVQTNSAFFDDTKGDK